KRFSRLSKVPSTGINLIYSKSGSGHNMRMWPRQNDNQFISNLRIATGCNQGFFCS
ncbi:hypothetical protein Tco_0921952, partial [Tanacetum coccineum]